MSIIIILYETIKYVSLKSDLMIPMSRDNHNPQYWQIYYFDNDS